MMQATDQRFPKANRIARWMAAALAAAALFAPGASQAALSVYQSTLNNGIDSGPAQIHGHSIVHVYFNNGSNAPTAPNACTPLGADEICQWAVRFATTGNLKIVDVAWGAGIIEDDPPAIAATELDGTGGNAVNGEVGATKLATVAVAGTSGELRLYTPSGFGFVDRNGNALTVGGSGVLIAKSAGMPWTAVSANEDHVCGQLGNGELRCFGAPFGGSPPVPAAALPARQVAVGHDFACALDYANDVTCWGTIASPPSPKYLVLAAGSAHICGLRPNLEVQCWGASIGTPAAGPFQTVTRGYGHACALSFNGSVQCWSSPPSPQASPPPLLFTDLAGGGSHTCGILSDGSIDCWGDDTFGQSSPPSPPLGVTYSEITAGAGHTCAIQSSELPIDNQKVTCWGDDSSNQSTPPTNDTFTSISAAEDFTCGIRTDGSLICWGDTAPTAPLVPYPQVAVGDAHACEIFSNGTATCWTSEAEPGQPSGATFQQIDSGLAFSCGVRSATNVLECWGENGSGQSTPPGGSFNQVATGNGAACAIESDATLTCWGSGATSPPAASYEQIAMGMGALGCGIKSDLSAACWGSGAPTPPSGAYADIDVGYLHACGLRTDASVACWGTLPLGVSPPAGAFLDVTAAGTHSCAVRPDGSVACWGSNGFGESTPPSLGFVSIDAGGAVGSDSTCGVTSGGSIACWGNQAYDQSEPFWDSDDDGLEDPVDNCPLAANVNQLDTDNDGAGDACDNCPTDPNPNQFDRDDDDDGDLCDNCVAVANSNQLDLDGNDVGDVCEQAKLLLVPDPTGAGMLARAMLQSGGPEYDLSIRCGSEAVGRVEIAMVMPLGITPNPAAFGPNCTATDCSAAAATMGGPEPNDWVDEVHSFAVAGSQTTGGLADNLYVVIQGDEGTDNRLCSPNQERYLGSLSVASFPSGAGIVTLSPNEIEDVDISCTPPNCFQNEPLRAPSADLFTPGPPVVDDLLTWVGPPPTVDATLDLEVVKDGTDPNGHKWVLLLSAESDVNRLTIGVKPPPNTAANEVRFEGCENNQQSNVTDYLCATVAGAYIAQGPSEDSKTFGPDPVPHDPSIRSDTMYVTLYGSRITNQLRSLNVPNPSDNPNMKTVLGRIVVDLAESDDRPVLVTDGAATVLGEDLPFILSDGTGVGILDYKLIGSGTVAEDSDSDGFVNGSDNCTFVPQSNQENRGGFKVTTADFAGDACQCGDASLDGSVLTADLDALRQVLAGQTSSQAAKELCSISGNTVCDVKDVLELSDALSGSATSVPHVCARSFPPGLPTDP